MSNKRIRRLPKRTRPIVSATTRATLSQRLGAAGAAQDELHAAFLAITPHAAGPDLDTAVADIRQKAQRLAHSIDRLGQSADLITDTVATRRLQRCVEAWLASVTYVGGVEPIGTGATYQRQLTGGDPELAEALHALQAFCARIGLRVVKR